MSGDPFWEFERTGWERAAGSYEEYSSDTVLFVDALLAAAGIRAGARLLDVACGPGFVSEAAAARGAGPVGLDVAVAMVERARRRCPGLTFVQGDAQQLPFADATFDAVTLNFGILHLAEPDAALAEARRVLVAEGRLAFSAWVSQGNAAAEIVDGAIAAYAAPVDLPQGPPYYRFAEPDECRRSLAAAGFDADSIRVETVTTLWRLPTASRLFEAELRAGVRTAAVLAAQPRERLDAIRAATVRGVQRHAEGEGFALPLAANVISARAGPPST